MGYLLDQVADDDTREFITARLLDLLNGDPDLQPHASENALWVHTWLRDPDRVNVSMADLLSWVEPWMPWPDEPPA